MRFDQWLTVAWRVKKKKGDVITSWYEAKILKFSGKLIFYSCVLM
jgi:hypothetical protein